MPLLLLSFTLALTTLLMSLAVPARSSQSLCSMRPEHLQIRLPRHGFTWLDGEDKSGRCDDVRLRKWNRNSSGSLDLFVYADGPSGSGRYWNVTIGVAPRTHSKPVRGVCLTTSTVGWRTLQKYKKAPLAWLDDLDKDGKAELILWSSFPIRENASLAEYGLVAWVYRLDSEESPVIDWGLSRKMARDIAAAYRSSLGPTTRNSEPLRIEAAEALELFADERCRIRSQNSEFRIQKTEFRRQRSEDRGQKSQGAPPFRERTCAPAVGGIHFSELFPLRAGRTSALSKRRREV